MKIKVILKNGNVPKATKIRYKIKVRVIEKEKPTFSSQLLANVKKLHNYSLKQIIMLIRK